MFTPILVPVILHYFNIRRMKRESAAERIRAFALDASISERILKLYKYRIFEESNNSENNINIEDPCKDSDQDLLFEHVFVLNYFEVICVEIQRKGLDEALIYEATGTSFIGMRDLVLKRLDTLMTGSQEDQYPNLVAVAGKFKKRASKENIVLATKINPKRPL